MEVVIDAGNSTVTMGVIRGGDVSAARSVATNAAAQPAALAAAISELAADHDPGGPGVQEIVLASVVPVVTSAASEAARQLDARLTIVDHTNIPLPIRVDQPAAVGNDRLVNALAAARIYGTPAIVVDLGTATTFDVVSVDGAFLGGAIAAGAALGLETLASRTAQLPRVPLVMPPFAIGRDTVAAMQAGAVIGHIGLVSELVRAISAELALDVSERPKVILTGGLANADWAAAIPDVDAIDPLLTLRGLALFHAAARAEVAAQA